MPEIPANEVTFIRERLNLNREQLAKRLDVSHWTVQSWERGQRACTGPAAILLKQIAEQADIPEWVPPAAPPADERTE